MKPGLSGKLHLCGLFAGALVVLSTAAAILPSARPWQRVSSQLAGVLAPLLALVLAGCGGGSSNDNTIGTNPPVDTNNAPVADAGADQSVDDGATVILDGSGSSDSDGDTLTFTWTQTDGPSATLSDAAAEVPTFTAPTVDGGTTLTFELSVSDGEESHADTVTITVNDVIAAVATLAPLSGEALGIRNDIVITFDEVMDPASLVLGEDLGAISDGGTWSAGNTVLTISPDAEGAWESGAKTLSGTVSDVSGNATALNADFEIRLIFNSFQEASVVIGQADFTGQATDRGGPVAADGFGTIYGVPSYSDGRLWVPDYGNHRVLGFDGIPGVNSASATWVVGQSDFVSNTAGTSATLLNGPQQALEYNGYFYVLEYGNNRIAIYDSAPTSPPGTATHVIGQADLNSSASACTASGLNLPETMFIVDGKLLVADAANHRVLIWNTVPTHTDAAPADLVLGQNSMTNCVSNDDNQDGSMDVSPTARVMAKPSGIWSDGERLVIADTNNNRVLIWNSFPASNFTPADVVLGQSDFIHSQENDDDQDGIVVDNATDRTLSLPYEGVLSNGLQLFVSDSRNNRVLIWNDFPTENFTPADVVLGQADFNHLREDDDDQDSIADANPSARTFDHPVAGLLHRDRMITLDQSNHRVLIFRAN